MTSNSFKTLTPIYDTINTINRSIYDRAMILDVGGRRHKVLESNFSVFPNTRLGKLARARNEEEILGLCDGYREDDGVGVPEFFFDRNWTR